MRFFKVCFAAMAICIAWISPFGAVELYKSFHDSRGMNGAVAFVSTIIGYPLWVVVLIEMLLRIAIVTVVGPVEALYHKVRHGRKLEEVTNVYVDRVIEAFNLEGYGNLNAKEALSRL